MSNFGNNFWLNKGIPISDGSQVFLLASSLIKLEAPVSPMPPNIAADMTPEVQVAVVEALYLLQAFAAAIVSFQIVQFFLFSRFKDAHKIVIYTIVPLLGFIQLFTVLTQIRAIGRSHKLNVDFEWIKSGIVTALWLWLAIESGVSKWGSDAHMTVACVLSLLFIALVFYSTLIMAASKHRGHREGRVALPE